MHNQDIYNITLKMTQLFENAGTAKEFVSGLNNLFKEFFGACDFKIYLLDEITKSFKDFEKPWENFAPKDFFVSMYELCKDLKDYKISGENFYFPICVKEKKLGVCTFKIKNAKELQEILPLLSKLISYAALNLQNSEKVHTHTKFHQTLKNIAKIIETQYELGYILPILGEMIDGFVSEHLIYVFLKVPKKREFKLIWPSKCLDENIYSYLENLDPRSKAVLQNDGKTGIFPLVAENKLIGAIVAYSKSDRLSQNESDYLEQLSKQASVTVERAGAYMKILKHATLDALTGLNNRHQFASRLKAEVANAKRQNSNLCCIMTDIDFFKSVNDTYGHAVGDCVLKNVAKAIQKELREYDIASRYGGEEFAILLPNTTLAEAQLVAQRLRAQIEKKKINIEDYNIPQKDTISVTISVGVSEYSKDVKDPQMLYQKADKGLYEAKETGRNKVVVVQNQV